MNENQAFAACILATMALFGLGLSVVLMGVAASMIAGILTKYRWIAWVGLVIILYVALRMLYEGADAALFAHGLPEIPFIKGPPPVAPAH